MSEGHRRWPWFRPCWLCNKRHIFRRCGWQQMGATESEW